MKKTLNGSKLTARFQPRAEHDCTCLSETYREVLPSQFVDHILYAYVLSKYGDQGEELLDQVPEALDTRVRGVLHEYFTVLDQRSMAQLRAGGGEARP